MGVHALLHSGGALREADSPHLLVRPLPVHAGTQDFALVRRLLLFGRVVASAKRRFCRFPRGAPPDDAAKASLDERAADDIAVLGVGLLPALAVAVHLGIVDVATQVFSRNHNVLNAVYHC